MATKVLILLVYCNHTEVEYIHTMLFSAGLPVKCQLKGIPASSDLMLSRIFSSSPSPSGLKAVDISVSLSCSSRQFFIWSKMRVMGASILGFSFCKTSRKLKCHSATTSLLYLVVSFYSFHFGRALNWIKIHWDISTLARV